MVGFRIALTIRIVEPPRIVTRAKRRHHITITAELARSLRASRRAPYRRMRLLPRPRPDIHVPVMKVLTLPVERRVMAGQRFHDEIMRFPEPVRLKNRIHV